MVEKIIFMRITIQFMSIEQKIEKNLLMTQNEAKKIRREKILKIIGVAQFNII